MHQLRWLLYRLKSLWHRQAREADLDAELQFHLDAEAEEHIEAGLPGATGSRIEGRRSGNVWPLAQSSSATIVFLPSPAGYPRHLQPIRKVCGHGGACGR